MQRSSYVVGVPYPTGSLQQYVQQQQLKTCIPTGVPANPQQYQQQYRAYGQLNTAVENVPAAPVSQGYGTAVKLPASVLLQPDFQNFKGKPAFYDSNRGLWFDGVNLYAYQPAAPVAQAVTAVELQAAAPAHGQNFPRGSPFFVENPSMYVLDSQ